MTTSAPPPYRLPAASLLLATLIVLFAVAAARGDWWNWTPPASHHAAVVKVTAGNAGGTGAFIGYLPDGRGLILTATHVVAGQRDAQAVWPDGHRSAGPVIAAWPANAADVAVFVVVSPPANAVVLPIAANPPAATDTVEICGYGGPTGRLRHFSATVTTASSARQFFAKGNLLSGDSGGPILSRGEIVAVVSGGANTYPHRGEDGASWPLVYPAQGCCVEPIRQLLAHVQTQCGPLGCQPPRIVEPRLPRFPPSQGPPPSTAPSDRPPPLVPIPPATPPPSASADPRVIVEQLAADPRFRGPPGPPGKDGRDGPDLDAVLTRLNVHDARESGIDWVSIGLSAAAALGLGVPAWAFVGWRFVRAARHIVANGRVTPATPGPSQPTPPSVYSQPQQPIVIESPSPPQITVHDVRYQPVESDRYAQAHAWALQQMARKYPGSIDLLETERSLLDQYLTANPRKG